MRIHTGLLLVAWIQTTLALVQLTGKITNVPRNYQLVDKEEYVNGENFGLRCSVRLNLLEGTLESQLLVNKNFEFKSLPLKPGKYDLTINSHDFTFLQDRYIVEVNESTILAYDYYLDKKDLGDAKDVTETPLVVKTVNSKQYYEVRLSSLQDMVMNSPLGVIFKNKIYTGLFVFSVVMMVGPYLLKVLNPEMAKRLDELKAEQAKQGTIFIDQKDADLATKGSQEPKVEEISREAPSSNARRRKH